MKWLRQRPRIEEGKAVALAADAAAWPFTTDSPVIGGVVRADRPLAVMLVDLTGLDWPGLEPLLPVARTGAADKGMLPVLVVDTIDLVPLRTAGFAYDVLPNVTANAVFAPELDWRAYLARRKRLLIEKWQPSAIVRLGSGEDW